MNWPPANATEMVELQNLHGRDENIAEALGVTINAVETVRIKLKIPTVPVPGVRYGPRMIGKSMSETEITKLYAGRRYVDWGDVRAVSGRGY